MKDNTIQLLLLWLKKSHHAIDTRKLKLQFLSHPDAPGVTAITDSLNELSVPNMAVEIPFATLKELHDPFLAYIRQGQEEQFAIVQQQEGGQWEVKMTEQGRITITSQKFEELFTGMAVLIDKKEPVNGWKRLVSRFPGAAYIIGASILLLWMLLFTEDAAAPVHLLLAGGGLVTSCLVLAKELGYDTTSVDKFCNLSSETDCSAVIGSKYSKVVGDIKLSDLSVLFFSMQVFGWLFIYPQQPFVAAYQYAVSAGAVLITVLSIYLQKFVLKKWCPLCLVICGVLWAQAAIGAIMFGRGLKMVADLRLLAVIVITAMAFAAIAKFLKVLLEKAGKYEELTISSLAFRRNYRLFLPYFSQLRAMNTSMDGIPEIVLGHEGARVDLIVVSNPLCKTCISLHHQLHQWIERNPQVCVRLRFYVPVENSQDKRTLVATKLIELYMKDASDGIRELDRWYDDPDPEAFYQRNDRMHSVQALNILKQHRQWCLSQHIFITPSIIVNGKRFPIFYEPSDIGFFLDELASAANSSNKQLVADDPHLKAVLS